MAIEFPAPRWPAALTEEGPEADPSILLSGEAAIGEAAHRILAVRVRKSKLEVDFRADLDEDAAYGEFPLEAMLEELEFFEDFDRSAVVSLASGDYVVWMIPSGDEPDSSRLILPRGAL